MLKGGRVGGRMGGPQGAEGGRKVQKTSTDSMDASQRCRPTCSRPPRAPSHAQSPTCRTGACAVCETRRFRFRRQHPSRVCACGRHGTRHRSQPQKNEGAWARPLAPHLRPRHARCTSCVISNVRNELARSPPVTLGPRTGPGARDLARGMPAEVWGARQRKQAAGSGAVHRCMSTPANTQH